MATIRFGPTIADVRGSLGPITYTRNISSHYIASRATRAAPQTPPAAAARANLSAATAAWRSLTPEQRQAWNLFATDPPEIDYDPWAEPSPRSGFSWYLRIYLRQLTAAQPPPINPPPGEQPAPPAITAATIAPYGAPHASSYITYTTPQPQLIQNPSLEAPYTAGLANLWKVSPDHAPFCTQETTDIYHLLSAQKYVNPGNAAPGRLYTQNFNLAALTPYHVLYTTKIPSGKMRAVRLNIIDEADYAIATDLTNRTWTPALYTYTPAVDRVGNFGFYQHSNTAGSWLMDDCAIRPAEHLIATAAIAPSRGRQSPDRSLRIVYAGPPQSASRIFIGDPLVFLFGAYRPAWRLFFRLYRQTPSGLRSLPATYTTLTG